MLSGFLKNANDFKQFQIYVPPTPQLQTQREVLPSPATRFDVDGLVCGVGWAVGAGVAVAGYLLQR